MANLSDNEIIKAFEYCVNNDERKYCPMLDDCPTNYGLQKQALDLINRQKAENERKTASTKGLHEKIEVLNGVIANNKYVNDYYIEKAKSEARKEFAERLKEKSWILSNYDETGGCYPIQVVTVESVDNLLKEMG